MTSTVYTTTTTDPTAEQHPLLDRDCMSIQLRQEALDVLAQEPELSPLLHQTVLAPGVETFDHAVLATVCFRLWNQNHNNNNNNNNAANGGGTPGCCFSLASLQALFRQAAGVTKPYDNKDADSDDDEILELGWTLSQAIRADAAAVVTRDPAMNTLLEVVLFSKGYAALVCHRVAYRLYHCKKNRKRFTALYLQSTCSAVFGVDLHPACRIGAGVMLDHGTGIVVGETAVIGNGSTLLHNVTLGGTGKEHGDRHPKIGQHVLIGCNSSILGNVVVGDCAKIGAGSVVLRSIPPHATAVGAPAKIIGKAAEVDPGSEIDFGLLQVSALHKVPSSVTLFRGVAGGAAGGSTATTTTTLPSTTQPSTTTSTSASAVTLDTLDTSSNKKDLSRSSSSTSTTTATTTGKNDKQNYDETTHKSKDNTTTKIISWPRDDLCPFREYRLLAQQAPRGTITIMTLGQILAPLGCTSCQVGACFFELDERNVGHVHYWNKNSKNDGQQDLCLEKKLVQITKKYCPTVEPQAVRAAWQRALEDNRQYHFTDGTDPHRCCC